jgi:hypothetical protein
MRKLAKLFAVFEARDGKMLFIVNMALRIVCLSALCFARFAASLPWRDIDARSEV